MLPQPEQARKMWDIIDMTYNITAASAERLSCIALDHLPQIAARARALLEKNRALLNSFLAARKELDCAPSEFGTTVAPRLRSGRVDDFCELLRIEFETTVVPGRFFEAPQHFRIGIGGTTEVLEQGLERVGKALDTFATSGA